MIEIAEIVLAFACGGATLVLGTLIVHAVYQHKVNKAVRTQQKRQQS